MSERTLLLLQLEMLIENRRYNTFLWQPVFEFIFCHIRQGDYIKYYHMSDKINSHICLMLSVYKSFHQTVKYRRRRNHILQDLTGLEI